MVKFSQPMVPLDEFEKVQKSFPVPVKIDPTIKGEWRWSDPFTAIFKPDEPYYSPPLLLYPPSPVLHGEGEKEMIKKGRIFVP
jgi:hypothetical protein